MAAVYAPLEVLRPARPRRQGDRWLRPAWLTDVAFYLGQALVLLPLFTWLLHAVTAPLRESAALVPLQAAFGQLPAGLQVVAGVVLADLLMYWGHRAQHTWGPLWRFHAVHHTSRDVDWLAAYREHPLDGLYTQLWANLPAMVLGLDLRLWLGVVVFRGMWAILVHTNVRLPLGPLKWVLGAPEFHRAHHAAARDVGHYANLAPWLDVLFGTHGGHEEPAVLGVAEPHPESWAGLDAVAVPGQGPLTASPRYGERHVMVDRAAAAVSRWGGDWRPARWRRGGCWTPGITGTACRSTSSTRSPSTGTGCCGSRRRTAWCGSTG